VDRPVGADAEVDTVVLIDPPSPPPSAPPSPSGDRDAFEGPGRRAFTLGDQPRQQAWLQQFASDDFIAWLRTPVYSTTDGGGWDVSVWHSVLLDREEVQGPAAAQYRWGALPSDIDVENSGPFVGTAATTASHVVVNYRHHDVDIQSLHSALPLFLLHVLFATPLVLHGSLNGAELAHPYIVLELCSYNLVLASCSSSRLWRGSICLSFVTRACALLCVIALLHLTCYPTLPTLVYTFANEGRCLETLPSLRLPNAQLRLNQPWGWRRARNVARAALV